MKFALNASHGLRFIMPQVKFHVFRQYLAQI
jgi:hypothetical protein